MCAPFTDDDVGKRVETAGGDRLGTVKITEEETAYVDADEGAMSAISAILDWETDGENIVPVDAGAVDEVTGDAIVLEDDRSSLDEAPDEGTDPVVERDESTVHEDVSAEQRGPPTGESGEAPDRQQAGEEGKTGAATEPDAESMEESGAERHDDTEEAPPDGNRTVTEERGEGEDR